MNTVGVTLDLGVLRGSTVHAEKVLLKLCKGLLGLPLSATSKAVLNELGQFQSG